MRGSALGREEVEGRDTNARYLIRRQPDQLGGDLKVAEKDDFRTHRPHSPRLVGEADDDVRGRLLAPDVQEGARAPELRPLQGRGAF